jgi:DNA-binding SARP family transcriptional activator
MSTDHDGTEVSTNGPAPTDEVEGRSSEGHGSDPGPYVDEPYAVSVEVMGTVRICGGERPIERAKSIELLTLLAMRRQGVTAEQAETALWPDRAPAPNTLNTVTTGARTPLGKAPDGKPLILHVRRGPDTGALRKLHPLVSTDHERFIARLHHAERRPVLGAIETLRAALNLVRGGAFEATPAGGYEWALTGLSEAIRRDVVDAAVRLGELCLEVGDVKGARWAAEQGRRADPYHEGLARLAMTSASLDGDPSGVNAVMRALQVDVEDGVEPYDTVEEQTAELYADLTTDGAEAARAAYRRDEAVAQEMAEPLRCHRVGQRAVPHVVPAESL